ncbi:hypothetical protein [Roseateles sp.]|uniref:hypothetical protein n=1 Tax=Roseateles sp. TaxID=1971397 RepID=UPI0031DE5810
MQNEITELSMEELELVSGGWAAVGWGLLTNALYDGAKAAGGWFMNAKGGGADGGTWERIGQSQMTA